MNVASTSQLKLDDITVMIWARLKHAPLTLWPRMRSVIITHPSRSDMSEGEVVSHTFLTKALLVLMGKYCMKAPRTQAR